MAKSIAVLCLIESDDPVMDPETFDVSTTESTIALRAAVIANLPHLTRVVAVMSEPMARLMVEAHHRAMEESGLSEKLVRPPSDYVAPAAPADQAE